MGQIFIECLNRPTNWNNHLSFAILFRKFIEYMSFSISDITSELMMA